MNIKDEIKALKEQKNAVILAHYYVADEIQEIADYVGDSLRVEQNGGNPAQPHHRLLRCLLHGGKRLSVKPRKEGADAGCKRGLPMAHMVTKAEVDAAREAYEDLAVVCYINSTAEIKSWSDVSVTSANAVQIVRNLPNQNILFIPDQNLGRSLRRRCLKKISFSSMATAPSIRISLLPRYRS